jgi:L-alanine-DL-glutamate epimerase-like enolase superfamily enzyme
MNRRDWLKTAGIAGIAGMSAAPHESLPDLLQKGVQTAPPTRARLEMDIVRLNLKHTWTTTMSSSEFRDTLHLRYVRDGVTGYGEGAPIVRYKEDAAGGRDALNSIREMLETADPWHFEKLMAEVNRKLPGQHAAKAALDIALMDWICKKLGVPLYRYFGLDPSDAAVTTFSIGMDKPEVVRQKIKEAEAFPILKIKVGLQSDEEMIASVRSATKKPLRVDANEGWTNKEEAVRKINWLETQGVQFIEQPMPAHMFDEIKWVRSKVHMPIIADEACTEAAAIPRLRDAYDGINVKLDKSGGIMEAYRWIQIAKALGMKTMLGCMISSSCSVTAAAHLSPLVDYADLDGNLLIVNDPFVGVRVEKGKLILPTGPGVGLKPRS